MVLGIIGCTVLTNELAYLVGRDPAVNGVVIVDNPEGRKLAGVLDRSHACEDLELVDLEHIGLRRYESDELVVWMNSAELHNSQERMRNTMASQITMMSASVDGVLLMYGQCRCQTLDIPTLEKEAGVPIVHLMDRYNVVVDDCISAILGSSDRYMRTIKRFKGAFFLTPGYVEGYALRMERQDIVELVDEIERMTIVFDSLGRPPLIKLVSSIDGGTAYHNMIDQFARTFDLKVMTVPCDMGVFEGSYDWAKKVTEARTRDRPKIALMAGQPAEASPSFGPWDAR